MAQSQAFLVQLQDIDQAQRSQIIFRSLQNSTIQDVIDQLKKQIGFQYEFEIRLQGQFFKIRETELVSSLFDPKQQKQLQYKKIEQKQQYQQPQFQQKQQYPQIEIKQQQPLFDTKQQQPLFETKQQQLQFEQKQQQPQFEVKTQNFTNNFNNKDQFQQKSQPFLQQHNQQKLLENKEQQQVLQTQTNLTEQIKQICEFYFDQYSSRLKNLEVEMIKITQQSLLIEKMQNQLIKQDQQLQVIPKDNLNDWKTQIESQIKNLYQLIKNQNPSNTQSPFVLQTGSNNMINNRQIFENITPTPVMMTEQRGSSVIKLTCKDQIEKFKLEEILQNAIISGNSANCIHCKKKISQFNCRQLGYLGDQYIQIQNEKNLSQLQQFLMTNYPKAILKCQNRNCNFFCIQNPMYTVYQKSYCPICLVSSVQSLQIQRQT